MKTQLRTSLLIFPLVALINLFSPLNFVFSQDCLSQVTVKLNNIRGGVYANQTVVMKA